MSDEVSIEAREQELARAIGAKEADEILVSVSQLIHGLIIRDYRQASKWAYYLNASLARLGVTDATPEEP